LRFTQRARAGGYRRLTNAARPAFASLVNRFADGDGHRRPTIGDVAEHAGVSKTTVSHVLSGRRPVARTTRERVERSIRDLGYRPDGLARSLRTQRTHLVALLIPDITNPFYPVLARGLESGMDGSGYHVVICNTDSDLKRALQFVTEVYDRHVDGIVLDSFAMSVEQLRDRTGPSLPVVWIGADFPDHPGIDIVRSDDEQGAFDATAHLIRRGCRRIAMIDGAPGGGAPRNDGHRRALAAAGIAAGAMRIRHGGWTREGGAHAMAALLEGTDPPDGVFCANDLMAIGALDVLRERGVAVPDEIAVVGFDDIDAAAIVSPPLTSVVNPAFETGSVAGALLLERMTGAYTGPQRVVTLPCRLVARASA
jgi:LacI family transcriptional regulator, galactose operon repressor